MGLPWMLCCIRVVLSRKGERRREGGRSPAAPPKEKERKNKPTARYLIGQEWRKGKGYKKKQFSKREKIPFIYHLNGFKPFAKRQLLCKL
jgi:hypothetical protein